MLENNAVSNKIKRQLQIAFNPSFIEIIDESHKHAGHAGAQSGKGHYKLTIKSDSFLDKSKINCHKMIYAELDELMKTSIHALSIKII